MKIIALVLSLVVFCSLFTACKTPPDFKDEYTNPQDIVTDPITDPVTDPLTSPATEPVTDHDDDFGKIEISLFTYRDTIGVSGNSFKEFTFPSVSVSGDKPREDNINAQIDAFCQSFFKRAVPNANSLVNGGAVVEFKIEKCEYNLLANSVLSIAFYAHIELFNAGFDELPERAFAALNISLTDGRILEGKDVFYDLEKIKSDISRFEFISEDAVRTPSVSEINDAMLQYRADYMIYPYVYFSASEALLCVELTQLQGSYALVKIPLSDFGSYFVESFSLR
ncbi:MAG: hypothetical protein IKB35_02670 [Clostridia bacterium]|nr:hypothetical protein [Clostridia bacterium]